MAGSSGGSRTAEEGTALVNDWVLASVDAWVFSGRSKDEIVDKVMSSYDMEVLRNAATRLRDGHWLADNIQVPQKTAPDYSRALATEVYNGLSRLQQKEPKVQFVVSAADLRNVPGVGIFLDHLDEPAISARLSSVDTKLQLIMDRLSGAEQLEGTVAGLAKTVDELKEKLQDHQGFQKQQAGNVVLQNTGFHQAAAAIQRVATEQQAALQMWKQGKTWAEAATGPTAGRRSRVHALQGEGMRDRSMSSKRGRDGSSDDESQPDRRKVRQEFLQSVNARASHPGPPGSELSQDLRRLGKTGDERRRGGGSGRGEQGRIEDQLPYTLVQRKKRGGVVQKGSCEVNAEGGLKAPLSVFLSSTAPNTTEEIVREKLQLCATKVQEEGVGRGVELQIVRVEHIPLKIPQGENLRSRCWKVTVAAENAEQMLLNSSYPAAWGWRKWNRGPRASQGEQGRGGRGSDGGA